MVLPALASARGAEILFEAVGRDGCEVPGVRIQLLAEVYSESYSPTKAPKILGEGNLF